MVYLFIYCIDCMFHIWINSEYKPYSCVFRYHEIHKQVYQWFDISFDKFGRTSTPQQTEVCQSIFKKLLDNNWLTENTMQQVWSFLLLISSLASENNYIYFFLFTRPILDEMMNSPPLHLIPKSFNKSSSLNAALL